MLPVEEIIGISSEFILFNSFKVDGVLNFKFQDPKEILLREIGSMETFKLSDLNDFEIYNSNGELILTSNDLKQEVVESVLENFEVLYGGKKGRWN